MKIETITEWLYRIKGGLKNHLQFNVMRLTSPSFIKTLSMNADYKDKHKGQRCFILGNGPSLRQEDLSVLRDEVVFTVNQINRLPDYEVIHPSYHFWLDKNFFEIDETKPEDQELLSVMKNINRGNPDVVCFFPIEQQEFCKKHGMQESLNINYYAHTMLLHEHYKAPIEYCRYTPSFGTVVQNCITMAIYMGFSEIYLLGCDNTGIMVTLKTAMQNNDDSDYAYVVSENEKKRMESMVSKSSVENYATSYAHTLRDYRILREYCDKKGIKLVNCSAATVIDTIPRQRLSEVLLCK